MDGKQFNKLKVGDKCIIKRGRDKGKICTVLYIKNNSVLIEPEEGTHFQAVDTNKKLRLTSYYEIDIKFDLKNREA